MKVWRIPILLGISTGAGLAAALFGDGWWDAASAIALGAPLAVALRHALKPAAKRKA
jgi:hypothetical protein